MAEIIWTHRAEGQLERAIKYIKDEQGTHYAKIVLERILSDVQILASNPEVGTVEPLLAHKKSEYRFLIVWSYKIIYRCSQDKVVISRVFHTSRNPKKLRGI
jgi:plasmid stabilization system protein ParE